MAYKCHQYSNLRSASTTWAACLQEYYNELRAFFKNSVGLQIVDEWSNLTHNNGHDYRAMVLKICGEDDSQVPVYLQLRIGNMSKTTATAITGIGGYVASASLKWDAVLHQPTGVYYNLPAMTNYGPITTGVGPDIYQATYFSRYGGIIYASKNMIRFATHSDSPGTPERTAWATSNLGSQFMQFIRTYGYVVTNPPNSSKTKVTVPVPYGLHQVVTVQDTTGFATGDIVYTVTEDAVYGSIVVENVIDSTHMTLSAVFTEMPVDSTIGHLPLPFLFTCYTVSASRRRFFATPRSVGIPSAISPYNGTAATESDAPFSGSISGLTPSAARGFRGSQFMLPALVSCISVDSASPAECFGFTAETEEGRWFMDVLAANEGYVHPYSSNPLTIVRGVTEQATTDTIVDNYLALSPNELVGKVVLLKTGMSGTTPIYQTRVVKSNTGTQIVVGYPFVYSVAAGAEFIVAERAYRSINDHLRVDEVIDELDMTL